MFVYRSTVIAVIFFLMFLSAGCIRKADDDSPALTGKYLGQTFPQQTIKVFAPDFVSTRFSERDAAFSPDGNEFYFTLSARPMNAIIWTKLENGQWTHPEVASFSGKYSDLEPAFSHDGRRLYFVSNRPLSDSGEPKDYDIWYVEREGAGWGRPVNLGAPVNTEKDEFYPSLAVNGNIYFTAEYEKSEDIYRSRLVDGLYQIPEKMSQAVNRDDTYEFNAFVAPDESYIIFTSYGRDDDMGGGDLYISFQTDAEIWNDAINLGSDINSPVLDYCPYVTPDGMYFFFTSRRGGLSAHHETPLSYSRITEFMDRIENGQDNIYWIDIKAIRAFAKK
ncbi:MAG: hypothetical protein AB1746_12055 [Candidatus Zixiibacteriota bacterium]